MRRWPLLVVLLLVLAPTARASGPCERAEETLSVLRNSTHAKQLAVRHQISGCSERDDGSAQPFELVVVDLHQHGGRLKRSYFWEGAPELLTQLKAIDHQRLPTAILPYLKTAPASRADLERLFGAGKFTSVEASSSGPVQACEVLARFSEPTDSGDRSTRRLSFVVARAGKATPLAGAPFEISSGALEQKIYWLSAPWIAVLVGETGAWSADGPVSWQAIRFFKVPAAARSCFGRPSR